MADEKDYIEEAQQEAQLRFGRELSATELANEFIGHDFDARVHHLKNLRSDGELSVREAAERFAYESVLRKTHEGLRKVGR